MLLSLPAPQILSIFHKPQKIIRFLLRSISSTKKKLLDPETSKMEKLMVLTGLIVNVRISIKDRKKLVCGRLHTV